MNNSRADLAIVVTIMVATIAIIFSLVVVGYYNTTQPKLQRNTDQFPAYAVLGVNPKDTGNLEKAEIAYKYTIKVPYPGYFVNTDKYKQMYDKDLIWVTGKGPDTSYVVLTNNLGRYKEIKNGLLKQFSY